MLRSLLAPCLVAAALGLAGRVRAQVTIPQATSAAGAGSPASTRAAQQQAAAYTQRLAGQLGLSAEQQAKVRQIILTSRLEMAAATLRAHESGDPTAVRPAMKAARDKADAALRGVLSPAQFTQYQQIVAARLGQPRLTSQTD